MRGIAARRERPSEKRDIFSRLFETHQEKPKEFDFDAVVSMSTSNVNAGSDTTAISMRAILYHLLRNPAAKQRLIDEIDEKRGKGELSIPVKFDEANKMPYLQAVLYEGMRLHPAVGMVSWNFVPPLLRPGTLYYMLTVPVASSRSSTWRCRDRAPVYPSWYCCGQ